MGEAVVSSSMMFVRSVMQIRSLLPSMQRKWQQLMIPALGVYRFVFNGQQMASVNAAGVTGCYHQHLFRMTFATQCRAIFVMSVPHLWGPCMYRISCISAALCVANM